MNHKETIIETIEAVNNINEELSKVKMYAYWPLLTITIKGDGKNYRVSIMSVTIHDSEWDGDNEFDGRKWIKSESTYIGDDSHYEPIEGYLRKKINKLVETISKIKL